MPKQLYIVKWTNLQTGHFGFSSIPRPLKENEALCERMNELTRETWTDEDGTKQYYRGSHEPVEWEGRG